MFKSLGIIAGNPLIRTTTLCTVWYGVTMASTTPFQAIIGIREFGMGDQDFAVFMFAAAVINMVSAVSLGALSDMISARKTLILALAMAGMAGYGLIYFSASKTVFIVCMLTVIPLARSLYSLLAGSMRRELDHLSPAEMTSVNSSARAIFALAWILVPGLTAWWLKDSPTMLPSFLVASVASLLITLTYGFQVLPEATPAKSGRLAFFASLALLATGPIIIRVLIVSAGSAAHTLHSTLHPLIMTGPAGGTMRDVGIYAGMLAALEIPFMLFWAWVAQRRSIEFALGVALLAYAVYSVLLFFVSVPWHLYAIGILNSCGAAAVLSLPVSYFQDLIKDRPGLSTSLLPIMGFVGGLMSAGGFALGTAVSGYSGTALMIGILCMAGAVGLLLLERHAVS
jgi:Na+/melibiose symporter-like transporter